MPHLPPHRRARSPLPRLRPWLYAAFAIAAVSLVGCRTRHTIDVEPTQHNVNVEPIYMTVDINLRVQQELDEFYSDIVAANEEQPTQGEDR